MYRRRAGDGRAVVVKRNGVVVVRCRDVVRVLRGIGGLRRQPRLLHR